MNLENWIPIYENNKKLDQVFIEKYGRNKEIFNKNCIELLVEIGEFVNETRLFKYWSTKTYNKKKVLLEYADIITMILYFYRELEIELKKEELEYNFELYEMINVLKIINTLYNKASLLMDNINEELIKEIFKYTILIGKKLEFKEEEIINAINEKHKIIEKRLNSDY